MILLPPLKTLLTSVAGAAIVAGFVFTPVSIDFDQDHFVFKASAALASDNDSSDDDSSDDDSSDDDSSDDDSSDDDSSDDDSSDDDDDSGSSSSDDDDDDDSDSSGSDDDDDDDSGSGSGGGGSHDDDSNDDHRSNARPLLLSVFLESLQNGSTVAKAEMDRDSIEIVYSDGWKEEISHGRYELKDPNGNTILSRPVNDKDIARLSSVF